MVACNLQTPLLYFVYTITCKVNATCVHRTVIPTIQNTKPAVASSPLDAAAEMLIKYVCRMPQARKNIQSTKKLRRRHINTRGHNTTRQIESQMTTSMKRCTSVLPVQACSSYRRRVYINSQRKV